MHLLLVILAAVVVGGIAGSIINVVASRLPAKDDPPAIGLPLRPWNGEPDGWGLVPFAGAYPFDTRDFDWPKLATEIGAALVSAIAFWRYGFTEDGMRACVFTLILLLILRMDWQHHLIFAITVAPAIVVALVLQALDSTRALAYALIAMFVAALVFFILFAVALAVYKRRALGFGDVLLAGLIGAMTGSRAGGALLLGMFLGAAGGLLLIAIRVRTKNDFIPYGAYLCLGAIIVILLGGTS